VERFCTDVCIIHQGKAIVQSTMEGLPAAVRALLGQDGGSTLEEMFVALVAQGSIGRRLSYV
jgi:ABC-type multidrug transport system ATPase subunit